MRAFFEAMFLRPRWYHLFIILLLTPLSLIYAMLMLIRRFSVQKQGFSIPIISIGNLIVGGTGKTPFVIALASAYDGVTIISRGYGRKSRGLVEVSQKGKILSSVESSGDEAMLMAKLLPHASVIVSENRILAIELAIKEGAKLICLDDGFSQVHIDKFEILLEPQRVYNYLPFPAGGFREFAFMKRLADLPLKEGKDFSRQVSFENLSSKMLLVTAIANPQRLDKYLPKGVIGKMYLDDHAYFDESVLKEALAFHGAISLLVTQKDAVKMQGFKLPLSLIKLELKIKSKVILAINKYMEKTNVK
jgi:tetraacyldisaccharide 4'-kinase